MLERGRARSANHSGATSVVGFPRPARGCDEPGRVRTRSATPVAFLLSRHCRHSSQSLALAFDRTKEDSAEPIAYLRPAPLLPGAVRCKARIRGPGLTTRLRRHLGRGAKPPCQAYLAPAPFGLAVPLRSAFLLSAPSPQSARGCYPRQAQAAVEGVKNGKVISNFDSFRRTH